MNILDTKDLSWNIGKMIGHLISNYYSIYYETRYAPASYGATLLPNGSIPAITRCEHIAIVQYMIVLFGKNNKRPFDVSDYKLYGDRDVLFLNINDNEILFGTTSFEPPKKKKYPFLS
ncbi:hypothetical protein GLOIN_2v1541912 [Rhizophagus clarus]|uniref:Uncharacterized protein n=1 Tax=Rhizophagus clarus TaxID=94130 RepID=A0A8H3M2T2_9GLOM|nr:hypothetical protein GLOIN_2v1541912 [Rhizophagus clarus]